MTAKHTPGPWFVSYEHCGGTAIAIDDRPGMDGERDYDLATVEHGDPEELKANGALIAAAPTLLAALQTLQANPNDPRAHRAALDAIKLAGGVV